MDTIDETLSQLQTVMELQIQGMQAFTATQLAAREALRTRDWPSLERALHDLDFQAEGLRCLEGRRSGLWTEVQRLTLGREGRFYEVARALPEARRALFTRLHQELKVQALGLRGLSRGLAAYVQTAGALIQAVVHELQPALKGRLYSRSGSLRGGDAQPLVLNTQF